MTLRRSLCLTLVISWLALSGFAAAQEASTQTETASTSSVPVRKLTLRERMQLVREQRQAEKTKRMALGGTLRERLQADRQAHLLRGSNSLITTHEDAAQVQEKANQIDAKIHTPRTVEIRMGEIHASDPASDWRGVAALSGQPNSVELAANDPSVTFEGKAGATYPMTQYLADRNSSLAANRVRAAFFSKLYFNRDGVRYERKTVFVDGVRSYQFVQRS